MICPNCGTDTTSKYCPNCGIPLNDDGINWNNATPMEEKSHKSGGAVLGIFFGIIAITAVICIILFGGSSPLINDFFSSISDENETNDTSISVFGFPDTSENPKMDSTPESSEIDRKEFIKSCSNLLPNYKSIERKPNVYLGQNYYFICYVSEVRDVDEPFSRYHHYYITYAYDTDKADEMIKNGWADDYSSAWLWACDYDREVWIMDDRDTSDDEYLKVLEGDILIIYGTFSGLTPTYNSETGESGEVVSLDIKFFDVISE